MFLISTFPFIASGISYSLQYSLHFCCVWTHEDCNCCFKRKSWDLCDTVRGTSDTWSVHGFWLALWWWIMLDAIWQPVSVVNIPSSSLAVQPDFSLSRLYCTYFWNHYVKRNKNSFSGDQTITMLIPCKTTYNNASFHVYTGVHTHSHRVPQPFHPQYMCLVQIKTTSNWKWGSTSHVCWLVVCLRVRECGSGYCHHSGVILMIMMCPCYSYMIILVVFIFWIMFKHL
jgi:hypothetical protein